MGFGAKASSLKNCEMISFNLEGSYLISLINKLKSVLFVVCQFSLFFDSEQSHKLSYGLVKSWIFDLVKLVLGEPSSEVISAFKSWISGFG